MHTLPSGVQFIEELISQISAYTNPGDNPGDNEQNDHAQLSRGQNQASASGFPTSHLGKMKPLMLTVHCIFPNELLLALDILDRHLVRRLMREDKRTRPDSDVTPTNPQEGEEEERATEPTDDVFYVISTSSPSPQPQSLDEKGYEVRLQSWNCTCPAFTIAAFRDPGPDSSSDDDPMDYDFTSHSHESCPAYIFGGRLTRGSTRSLPPVCKHLLACLLAVRCPGLLGSAGEDAARLSVSIEELAGLCAGWGG